MITYIHFQMMFLYTIVQMKCLDSNVWRQPVSLSGVCTVHHVL